MLMAGALLCVGVSAGAMYGKSGVDHIDKEAAGSGGRKYEFTAEVEDEETLDIEIDVPEQRLTQKEASEYLKKEKLLLQEKILGKNSSFEEIRHDLILPDSSDDGSISISWFSSDPEILNIYGEIGGSIPKDGTKVKLSALLSMNDTAEDFTEKAVFELCVFPKASEGNLKEDIIRAADELNQGSTEDKYLLPESVNGKSVKWYLKQGAEISAAAVMILFIGIYLAVSRKKKADKAQKERTAALTADYPEIVSRLMLMTASGCTVRSAFARIAAAYKKQTHAKTRPGFEEIVSFCRDLDNGIPESAAYERLAERCALPSYKTLCVLLIQNIRKGGSALRGTLEQEAVIALAERKRLAKLASDAAALKLLLPLGMMLMTALALMLIPALMAL